jgi:hypothetical protein
MDLARLLRDGGDSHVADPASIATSRRLGGKTGTIEARTELA